MNNLPLVSIVVPSYNHERYVKQTIESIVNQTYANIELIVIDDGSQDSSPQIIEELSQKHNFKFIHRPNRGLSATLNEGIRLSKGNYWCSCASDDVLKLDKIEKQVKFMEENPEYGMCFAKIIIFNNTGDEKPLDKKYSKGGWIFSDLIIGRFSIPAVTNMIRKDVFDDVGLFDESLWVEDWDMWVRIANKYPIGYLNEYLAYYREHETNISKQIRKMYQAKFSTLNKWKDLDDFTYISKLWRLYWFNMLSRNYKIEARKHLSLAMKNIFHMNSIKGIIKYYLIKEKKDSI